MFDGVKLTLLAGPVVPSPVSRDVLDALQSVEVRTTAGERSVFQLTFSLSPRSPLHTLFLLTSGSQIPLLRFIIALTVNGGTEVLLDGVMTHHEIAGGADGQATLSVTGEDLTRVMDYIDFTGTQYPAMPPEARVAAIIAKYAVFGMIPLVIPSVMMDIPIPTDRIPVHKGTDLCYINGLADQVGYVFYVEPGPKIGTNKAYWGPDIKVGEVQPPINVDMDAHTNTAGLSFSFDSENATLPIVVIQDQTTKSPIQIPIPDITPLNPPLGLIPPIPKSTTPIDGTTRLGPVRSALIGLAKAARKADALTATGSVDALRYGHVLKARKLVSARGAGPAFDGLYYVKSVTHKLQRGSYQIDFTLTRNGLVSTVPRVPV
jgi:hypothetical protein